MLRFNLVNYTGKTKIEKKKTTGGKRPKWWLSLVATELATKETQEKQGWAWAVVTTTQRRSSFPAQKIKEPTFNDSIVLSITLQ